LNQLKEFCSHWSGRLAGGTTGAEDALAEVRLARDELVKPLQGAGVAAPSSTFRFEYSRCLIGALQPIVEGKNSYAAINALEVAGYLGTDAGVSLAMQHADAGFESRPEIRTWAAKALMIAVQSGGLDAASINRSVRRLERAGLAEEDWIPLHSQLAALAAVDAAAMEISAIQPVHEARIKILDSAITRLDQQHATPELILAIAPGIMSLQTEFLRLRPHEQEDVGKMAAPVFGRFLQAAQNNWDRVRADDAIRVKFSQAVNTTEVLLRLIDAEMRQPPPPRPEGARQAWDQDDRDVFLSVVEKWTDILSRSPYQ